MIYTEYLNGATIVDVQKLLAEKSILSPSRKDQWSKSPLKISLRMRSTLAALL